MSYLLDFFSSARFGAPFKIILRMTVCFAMKIGFIHLLLMFSVQGCGTSHNYRNDVELELGRCRRTDGKKWRCRRGVVANQKYCEMHMHRGSKQHMEASKPAAILATIPVVPGSFHSHPTTNLPSKADYRSLNTNLCISIPTSAKLITTNDDTRTTSNSSDTTISDTMVGANQNKNLSS